MNDIINVGVVGSRRRDSDEDYAKVSDAVRKIREKIGNKTIMIVSGGAYRGADRFAELIAKQNNYHITIYRPQYNKIRYIDDSKKEIDLRDKTAPLERNDLIAKQSEILIACVHPDRNGGTEDAVRKFQKYHSEGRLILV